MSIHGSTNEALGSAILEYVTVHAEKNSPESVIACIEEYQSLYGKNMSVGLAKGTKLASWVKEIRPKYAIELGTFFGYSAVTLANELEDGSVLYSVDIDERTSKYAEKIAEYAGLKGKIRFMTGVAATVIDVLNKEKENIKLDFVLLDHSKSSYVPDLQQLINSGMLNTGCVIAADNCLVPGAPEYLEYVKSCDHLKTKSFKFEMFPGMVDIVERSVYLGLK